ncbi:glycosyl hydrolase [Sphaerisporangium sp. TRM90804]|uniref:glycosyl hydrolase n=1 Tax=Sphaerisporangium sp. TRM90804 TaxID=3031113 RepID=UPI00244BAF8D|nr:glycosyl hydrolase [Sphaerisporangium sp. TRM90804]MDH2427522.1 glycosyl hydrolase [Sphaerisporangium sp. TRM90804]
MSPTKDLIPIMSATVPHGITAGRTARRRLRPVASAVTLAAVLGASLVNGALPAGAAEAPLSQGRTVTASSSEGTALSPAAAVDGKSGTRWSSAFSDKQWLRVDLGEVAEIDRIVLNWERAYATAFRVQTSTGSGGWKTVYSTTAGKGGVQTLDVSASARYVRLYSTKRATRYGVSLWEFQVFGEGSATPAPSATPTRPAPSSSPSKPAPSTTPTKPAPSTTPTKPAPSASPSKTPTKPSAASAKKGVGVWQMPGVSTALANSKASWYYTWAVNHNGVTTPAGTQFVPMIWGAASVTEANLAQAKAAGPYLLGFNEPDFAEQSNMSVDQALSLWPKLMNAGKVLGSPAVAWGGDRAGGWLDRFMTGAAERNYRVDFITLHWYGGDFRTEAAVGQLKSYIQNVYNRYRKPIWLTEYALIDFSNGVRFPTEAQQAAFVTASAEMLESLPYVQRYAWFGLGADDDKPSSGLFHSDGSATPAGRAFQAIH